MTLLLRSGAHYVAHMLQLYDNDSKLMVIGCLYSIFGDNILQ